MNLLNLDDVLTMNLSQIDELVGVFRHEYNAGFVRDQLGRKHPIDKERFLAVLAVLEQAAAIKRDGHGRC